MDDADDEDLDDTSDHFGKRKRGIVTSAKKEGYAAACPITS